MGHLPSNLLWYQTKYLSLLIEPLSRPVSSIKRLPARSKLPMIPPYFALDISLSFNLRVTFHHLPWCYLPDKQQCRGPIFKSHPLSFCVSMMEFPKKGFVLHHDDLKQRNEGIDVMDRPLREEQSRPRRFVRVPKPYLSVGERSNFKKIIRTHKIHLGDA